MRFSLPLLPIEFTLPDDWWAEAGMVGFRPSAPAYRSGGGATIVPLRAIEPPFRFPEHPKDWRGFKRERMIRILSGIAVGAEIPAVPVANIRPTDVPESQFEYRVWCGLHRFYASIAANFTHLPVVIK